MLLAPAHSLLLRRSPLRLIAMAAIGAGLIGCNEGAAPETGPEGGPAASLAATAAPAFATVTTGGDHSCAVTPGTRAYCWGGNTAGQLGTSDKTKRLTATPVSNDPPFEALDAGTFNTCGVTTDHRAWCWGRNRPNGTRTTPTLVSETLRFTQVSAGADHVCGITASGKAYCRGVNSAGQLGDGSTTTRSAPVPVAGGHTFRQISTSDYHTCAVTVDDRAFCWGDNAFGQIGDGTAGGSDMLLRPTPVAVKGRLRFKTISAGTIFTCGLTTDDRAWCWGSNLYGQLGDETLTDRTKPTSVHGGKRFIQLNAGNSHVCAVASDDRGFCWGRGAEGQLGNGKFDTISHGMKPQLVAGGHTWRQIAAGGLHSCGVTTGSVAYCWGENYKGRLGDGTEAPRSRPVKVLGTN
jgi:alpha-tubulin suppressor-like RCC1 family protein